MTTWNVVNLVASVVTWGGFIYWCHRDQRRAVVAAPPPHHVNATRRREGKTPQAVYEKVTKRGGGTPYQDWNGRK